MADPHETLKSLKQGNALKIETLELWKEGAVKTFDALIAQAHKDNAACDQLGEKIGEKSDNNTAQRDQEILSLLNEELNRVKDEMDHCFPHHFKARLRQEGDNDDRRREDARAADQDRLLLSNFKEVLECFEGFNVMGPSFKEHV